MSYPVKFAKIITPIAFAISLAACGGGATFGGSGSTPAVAGTTTSTSNPNGVVASSISLSASSRRLDSSGSSPIELSVVAKDANNVILKDAAITFSVNNDANLSINSTTGSQGGVHTATLTPGSNENRTVTVTATSGDQTKSINIDIIGTQLKLQGPESISINKATDYTIKLLDSAEKPIVGDISIVPIAGATITPSNGPTDTNGEFSFSITNSTGGEKVIKATSLGATISKEISISDNDFTISSINEEINISTLETINLSWIKAGLPQSGLIKLHATRGTLSTDEVDINAGSGSFMITSARAGSATITATVVSIGLQTSITREFVATTPSYLNTQASPTIIKPNTTSRIIARVRDDQDNPVKNIKVNYSVTDTINGRLKSGGQATTDSLGRAEVIYEAGDSTSGFEGVVINTYLEDFNTITDSIKLTVGGDALRLVLGTDEKIAELDVRYKKQFVVIVTDSAGNPVKGKEVDFTIAPTHYIKGRMVLTTTVVGSGLTATTSSKWIYTPSIICPSEDSNNNKQLDNGEDTNGNNRLEPTQDATITSAGITGDDGSLLVDVIYPQSHASWSVQLITAKTLVNGTEYVENVNFYMPLTAADISNKDVTPPNGTSPYGVIASCSNPN